jgi:hypothetical protein
MALAEFAYLAKPFGTKSRGGEYAYFGQPFITSEGGLPGIYGVSVVETNISADIRSSIATVVVDLAESAFSAETTSSISTRVVSLSEFAESIDSPSYTTSYYPTVADIIASYEASDAAYAISAILIDVARTRSIEDGTVEGLNIPVSCFYRVRTSYTEIDNSFNQIVHNEANPYIEINNE